MGRLYGRDEWRPGKIIRQIFAMQALFYVAYGASLWLVSFLTGVPFNALDGFFSAQAVTFSTTPGWSIVASTIMASGLGAGALVLVVERAKKCLDFTFTVFFLHFVAVWAVEGFPVVWQWWLVQCTCLIGMNALGEVLCMRRELAEITVADIVRDRRGDVAIDLGLELPKQATRTIMV